MPTLPRVRPFEILSISTFIFLTASAMTSPVSADSDCNNMLKFGIYDTSDTQTSSVRSNLVKSWLCNSTVDDIASARSAAQNAGVGIDIFSLNYGSATAESNFHSWKSNFCSSDLNQESQDIQNKQTIRQASDVLVKSFVSCLNAPGFYAWIERDSKSTFVIHAKLNALGPLRAATITSFSITPKSIADSCSATDLFSPGKTIVNEIVSVCKRSPDEDVLITLNTDIKGYPFVLPKDPPVPIVPIKRDYSFECLAGDGDSCVKRAAEIRLHCSPATFECNWQASCWENDKITILQRKELETKFGADSLTYLNSRPPLNCDVRPIRTF